MLYGQFFEQFIKISVTAYLISLFLPSNLNNACYALIIGDVVSEIATFLYNYIFYILKNRHNNFYRDSKSYTIRILKISLPVAFASYIRSGLSTLKQILIPSRLEKSGISSSIALSKYGVVTGMAMPVIMFPRIFIESFSGLLIPEFSRYYAKKDFKKMRQVTKLIIFVSSLFSVFVTIIIYIFSNKISYIMYQNIEVGSYIKLLCPTIFFIYVDVVFDSILKAIDEQLNVMLVNVVDLIVSVAFIYFFVPILGFSGYVFSIFLSELLNFILSGLKLVKIFKN